MNSHGITQNCVTTALPLRLSSLPLRDAHMTTNALIWVRLNLACRYPEAESAGNLYIPVARFAKRRLRKQGCRYHPLGASSDASCNK